MIGTNGNGKAWTWVFACLLGFGDAVFEVPSSVAEAAATGKLPDEFPARRLTKMVPKPVGPGQAQLVPHPWLAHQFKAIGPELRIRGATVCAWAPATREAVTAVLEEWEPSQVKVASAGEVEVEASRLKHLRGG